MSNTKQYQRYLLKKIFYTLLLIAIILVPVELFSRFIAATSLAPFGSGVRVDQKFLVADSIQKNFQKPDRTYSSGIVAVGDSIIARSFYPELFSSLLNSKLVIDYPVYNLGVEGSSLSEQLTNFRHLVKKGIKPSVLIIDVPVHILNTDRFIPERGEELSDDSSLDYYTRCERERVTLSARIYCQFADRFYFFKLLHYYHQQINNMEQIVFHTSKVRYKNIFINDPAVSTLGFSPIFELLTTEKESLDRFYQPMLNVYKNDYKHYIFGTERLNHMVDVFDQNSTKVILVLMPLYHPVMRKVHDAYSLPQNKTIIEGVEKFAREHNVAFVNLFEELQSPENFQDPVHLNVIGATRVTTLLANKILSKDYIHPEGYLDSEIYELIKEKG